MPLPLNVIPVKGSRVVKVILKALAPGSKTMLLSSISTPVISTVVRLEKEKVATSSGPFGIVAGVPVRGRVPVAIGWIGIPRRAAGLGRGVRNKQEQSAQEQGGQWVARRVHRVPLGWGRVERRGFRSTEETARLASSKRLRSLADTARSCIRRNPVLSARLVRRTKFNRWPPHEGYETASQAGRSPSGFAPPVPSGLLQAAQWSASCR